MKVVFHGHRFPPGHNAGAEWMALSMLRHLVGQGHECVALFPFKGEPYEIHGIRVLPDPVARKEAWSRSDVAVTHLDLTRMAVRMSRETGTPLVHLVHNHRQLRYHRVRPEDAPLVVFNSWWLAEWNGWWPGPSMVLPPPVFAEDYRTDPGECLTLVNLTEAKGAPLFWRLAEAMPDRRFLAVKGAYGWQIVPDPVPPNVEVWEQTPDARSIYARTRVLLMPSSYESWGRVAIEAASSGIPTIAHPTPGLRESLDYAGLFVDREEFDEWTYHIEVLDRTDVYAEQSALARKRSDELDPTADLELFETALVDLASQPRRRRTRGRG